MDMFLCSLFPTCQQLSIIKPQQTTPPTSPRFRNTRSGLRMVFIIPTKRWHLCLYKAEDAKSISGTLLLNHIRWNPGKGRGGGGGGGGGRRKRKDLCHCKEKESSIWFNSEPATINVLRICVWDITLKSHSLNGEGVGEDKMCVAAKKAV